MADTINNPLLRRCLDVFKHYEWKIRDKIGVYHASGNLAYPYQQEFACFGCKARHEIEDGDPNKTPKDFPHEKDCKFVEFYALLKELEALHG